MTTIFHKLYDKVAFDLTLHPTAKAIFLVILKLSRIDTYSANIYIDTIAKRAGKSVRTVRRYIPDLIERGYIDRNFRKSPHNHRMNLASCFVVSSASSSVTIIKLL